MKPEYRLPAKFNRKIGKAMHDYSMLEEGDSVMVAVSGGVDSLVLGWVLKMWQQKAPINFTLLYLHVDHGFWQDSPGAKDPRKSIGEQLGKYDIKLEVTGEWQIEGQPRTCFLCARNRRSQLFDLAREKGINKIALGHHKDDLIETFMLNAIYSGNISTMVPKQNLFGDTLSIIRPMAYLEKQEILEIASSLELSPVKNFCTLSDETRREKVRTFLESLYNEEPGARTSLFAALSNVRKDYLL
ncbi:MAG: tRNA lysidine(34) synthetase [Desulforhopalus sp.]